MQELLILGRQRLERALVAIGELRADRELERGGAGILERFRDAVRAGAQVAFVLEPTSIQRVADTSFGGGVMPQKSTDFFPKLLTGLTIYRLEK